jgi:hypothetical protein
VSQLDTVIHDGEERRLGCLVPDTFPTAARCFADAFQTEMLTLDQVRAHLAAFGGRSAYGRRERFAGPTYIRNQRSHGSCNGWSPAGILSRLRALRGEPYVCLSGADAYSQMNGGRDDGSLLSDAMKIVEANGIAPESLVPWNQIYTHQISAEAKAARARFKGFAYAVDTEEELATAMLLGRMAVVAVHATDSFMRQDGDGVNLGGNGPGNHSVFQQDIRLQGDGTLNYDMGNSWDVTFCSGGYTWLTFAKHLRETIKHHRFWVLAGTSDDDKDDSVPPKVRN